MNMDEAIEKVMTCATEHDCEREEACFAVVQAISKVMTCATAHPCEREEACFAVVAWAEEQVEEYRTRDALIRAAFADAEKEAKHYAPHFPPLDWETARPDWSAA